MRSDDDDKMAVIHNTIDEVRQIIESNLNNQGNLDGVLTRKLAQYTDCLVLKHRELEDLFRQDEHQLAESSDISKRQAEEIKDEIREVLEKQRQELQATFDKRKMV